MTNQFSVPMSKGTASVRTIGSVRCDASTLIRGCLTDYVLGNISTPADAAFDVQLFRVSTAGTGSGVTPSPLDPADAAAIFDASDTYTVDPTIGAVLFLQAINQRAALRWVASPGQEPTWPATANNGIAAGLAAASASDFSGTVFVQGA